MNDYRFFLVVSNANKVKSVLMSGTIPETKNKQDQVLEITVETYIDLLWS